MIYIAGPFFTQEERENLNEMISWVKSHVYNEEFFIPMEHFIPNGEHLSNEQWSRDVFNMDVAAIDKCNMMVALYLGHYSDTGTAWEIGYAYAKHIPVLLYIPEKYRTNDMSIMPINSSIGLNYDISKLNQK